MTDRSEALRGTFWLDLLCLCDRLFGRWGLAALLHAVAAVYAAALPTARHASRRHLAAFGISPSLWNVYRHLCCFAVCGGDRLRLAMGRRPGLRITTEGLVHLEGALARGGTLLFLAHCGNFDVLRHLPGRPEQLPISLVLDRTRTPRALAYLERRDPQLAASILDAGQPPAELALAVRARLELGHLVGLMVDRPVRGQSVTRVRWPGGSLALPHAPWLLAALLGAPVVYAFPFYRGRSRYHVRFAPAPPLDALRDRRRRNEALAPVLQDYADRLAAALREAPLNWFNFDPADAL